MVGMEEEQPLQNIKVKTSRPVQIIFKIFFALYFHRMDEQLTILDSNQKLSKNIFSLLLV